MWLTNWSKIFKSKKIIVMFHRKKKDLKCIIISLTRFFFSSFGQRWTDTKRCLLVNRSKKFLLHNFGSSFPKKDNNKNKVWFCYLLKHKARDFVAFCSLLFLLCQIREDDNTKWFHMKMHWLIRAKKKKMGSQSSYINLSLVYNYNKSTSISAQSCKYY